jgi:group I intron endonuclease
MTYCRNCPDCDTELCTENKYYHRDAVKLNKKCISCSLKGKKFTEEHRKNLSKNHADVSGKNNPFWGKKHSDEVKKILSDANVGKDRFSDEYKRYLSEKMSGTGNPFYGKTHSEETKRKLGKPKTKEHRIKLSQSLKGRPIGKRYDITPEIRKKMRISATRRMRRVYGEEVILPNVNLKETEYFSRLESERGWDGIYFGKDGHLRQYCIESLGYWVDFYDPVRNIVVEYDETRHYNSDWTLTTKDIERQNEIIQELDCEFYRYNEVLEELKRYN